MTTGNGLWNVLKGGKGNNSHKIHNNLGLYFFVIRLHVDTLSIRVLE
jgi:hypothetical protein